MLHRTMPMLQLSVQGAITLASDLLAAAEPIEERPSFLGPSLAQLDAAIREMRGVAQYRSQVRKSRPSRQQHARADVQAQLALDGLRAAIRSYVVRLAVIAEDSDPATVTLARQLVSPLVVWQHHDERPACVPAKAASRTTRSRGRRRTTDAAAA